MALQRRWVIVAKLDGQISKYKILPPTVMAFEREFKQGLSRAFGEDSTDNKGLWLAWKAEHDSGIVVPPFDDWAKLVEAIDFEVETIPLDTTQPLTE